MFGRRDRRLHGHRPDRDAGIVEIGIVEFTLLEFTRVGIDVRAADFLPSERRVAKCRTRMLAREHPPKSVRRRIDGGKPIARP
jgi:hypothetical protein